MRIEFEIVSGARAGRRDAFEKSFVSLGRHPLSDVRFDAEADLDVSTRHAAVLRGGAGWLVRDLESRNGTFLNGRRVAEDTPVADGDVIRLGQHGPEVRVTLPQADAERVVPAVVVPATHEAPPRRAPAAPAAPPGPRRAPEPAKPSATAVLRTEIGRQSARTRALLVTLAVVVVGAGAVVVWQGLTARAGLTQLGSALDSLGRELATLRTAKVAADSEVARLEREMAGARSDPSRLAGLQLRYADAQRRQRDIATAQTVDYRAIVAANHAATAIVYVQFPDTTQMWTGTAFCVSSDGTMLTNRHVVLNDAGERPARIAIQFSGSRDVHPGRLVRVAPDADIAVIRVESAGPFPVVSGLDADAAPEAGDPIALLGFPLGTDLPMGGTEDAPVARATLATGTISRVLGDSLLQLDAFSGTGASGSPILDRGGRVIGIEYGGARDSGGRIIFGLPIRRALALL